MWRCELSSAHNPLVALGLLLVASIRYLDPAQSPPHDKPSFDVERVVQKLLREAHSHKDISPDQLDSITKAVVLEDLKHHRYLARVDLDTLQKTFLAK